MSNAEVIRAVRTSRRGLVYQQKGSGRPVVLVHGWCLSRAVWLYQEQALLDAGFEVISVDLAGFGDSDFLAPPYSLERHGADIADLLDELELAHATVVGFAYGAAVLLSLPSYSRVGGVISIGVPSAAGAPYPKMRTAMLRDWPIFAHRSARAICGREHSEESLRWLGDVFARTSLTSAIAGVELLAEFEPLDLASSGRSPILFIHGIDDVIVDRSVSERAAHHFDQAQVLLIKESGHFVPWDQPLELADAIVTFADGTSAP